MATENMAPDLQTQRQMLEQKRDAFKTQGFEYFLEAEAAKVQDPGSTPQAKKALAEQVATLEAQSRNAYAAAKRLQEMLDALPADETKEVEADA